MRLRGMHDIKTHGSLARKGLLISVARDWHKLGGRSGETDDSAFADSWNAAQHIVNKKQKRPDAAPRRRECDLEKKVRAQQRERLIYLIDEFQKAVREGLPVSFSEFAAMKKRLAGLQLQ